MGFYRVHNDCDKPAALKRRKTTPRGSSRIIKLGRKRIMPRQKATLSEDMVTRYFHVLSRAAQIGMLSVVYQRVLGEAGDSIDFAAIKDAAFLPHLKAVQPSETTPEPSEAETSTYDQVEEKEEGAPAEEISEVDAPEEEPEVEVEESAELPETPVEAEEPSKEEKEEEKEEEEVAAEPEVMAEPEVVEEPEEEEEVASVPKYAEAELSDMKKADLKLLAEQEEVDLSDKPTKAVLITRLLEVTE